MPKNFSLVCPDKGQAEIYCSSSALPSQNAGNGVIVFCPARQLDRALTRCNGVQGISVTFAGTAEDFAALLKYYRVEASEVVRIGPPHRGKRRKRRNSRRYFRGRQKGKRASCLRRTKRNGGQPRHIRRLLTRFHVAHKPSRVKACMRLRGRDAFVFKRLSTVEVNDAQYKCGKRKYARRLAF